MNDLLFLDAFLGWLHAERIYFDELRALAQTTKTIRNKMAAMKKCGRLQDVYERKDWLRVERDGTLIEFTNFLLNGRAHNLEGPALIQVQSGRGRHREVVFYRRGTFVQRFSSGISWTGREYAYVGNIAIEVSEAENQKERVLEEMRRMDKSNEEE